ncbi:hypothetical protein B0T21DRAFT_69984 [Apiosordaria backusii]|uniref:Uncharacterized protein n=1 Tax=Apiosordaria backusii TaxID=314023 RepID=A0AA40AEK0_9PEZI|nr:hypothetical protein B0T21DRAFT_69984 [Apiosordaria backusii]
MKEHIPTMSPHADLDPAPVDAKALSVSPTPPPPPPPPPAAATLTSLPTPKPEANSPTPPQEERNPNNNLPFGVSFPVYLLMITPVFWLFSCGLLSFVYICLLNDLHQFLPDFIKLKVSLFLQKELHAMGSWGMIRNVWWLAVRWLFIWGTIYDIGGVGVWYVTGGWQLWRWRLIRVIVVRERRTDKDESLGRKGGDGVGYVPMGCIVYIAILRGISLMLGSGGQFV